MRIFLLFCIILGYSGSAFGRDTLVVRLDTFPSTIRTQPLEKSFKFTPVVRPLVPIPGGRQAYFTYLWDFGDGNFSTSESPEHQYSKPGEYDVSLYIVNNYDNGPRPKKPKTKVRVDSNMAVAFQDPNRFEQNFFKSNGIFQLYKNADAVPGEDMSLVVGVRPIGNNGKILILTNEKLINPNGFMVASQSRYHNEQIIPVTQPKELESLWAHVNSAVLTQSGSPDYGFMEELDFTSGNTASDYFNELLGEYKTVSLYDIEGTEGEGQFSIINLDITPEMLADTNAIVTITGIYLADGGNPVIHKLDVPVTTSHDPNKMSVRPAIMDYRLQFKKKKLTYKVQFQNDGEGDAKIVRLEMFFPEQIDIDSFELLNLYPGCAPCASDLDLGCYTLESAGDNKLIFTFRGIALPGTASPTVTDADSTKGFIRFTLNTHKKLQNKSLPSYTDIYFDKNDPIRTNRSTARFRPGLSPIITLGLNAPMKSIDDQIGKLTRGYSIGIGLAPIAPYKKPYWQVELYAGTFGTQYLRENISASGEIPIPDDTGRPIYYGYKSVDSSQTKQYLSLQVPLQLRYNFGRYISMGIGAIAKTDIHLSGNKSITYHIENASGVITNHTIEEELVKDKMSRISFAPLIDLNIGKVYLGPSLGLRYHYDKTYKNNLNIYLAWRL